MSSMDVTSVSGREQWLNAILAPAGVVLPERSTLYGLEVQGAGTPCVESLTSYTARLAEAHCVSPRTLAALHLLPLLGRTHLLSGKKVGGTFWRKSTALNGVGEWAADWARVLENLTAVRGLSSLTLLPWGRVLPARGLLRRRRAWCALCLDEWRTSNLVVYEPLIWCLEVVETCPRHGLRLQDSCVSPTCGAASTTLMANSRVGHCPRCGFWQRPAEANVAASGDRTGPRARYGEDAEWQSWVAECVGEMLARSSRLSVPPEKGQVARSIALCLQWAGVDSPADMGRLLGVSARSATDMASGDQMPQLSTLLKFCRRMGIKPTDFLTGNTQPSMLTISEEKPARRRRKGASPRVFDRAGVEAALRAVLVDELENPPMVQVARRLGYDPSHLHRHFPRMCSAISAGHKASVQQKRIGRIEEARAEVRRVAIELTQEGLYPSYKRVGRRLRRPRQIRDAVVTVAWRESVDGLMWGRVEKPGAKPVATHGEYDAASRRWRIS